MKKKEQGIKPKNSKERQYILSNNHACLTATMLGLLSSECEFTIMFPIKWSHQTVDFPKIRFIKLRNGNEIDLYKLVKERIGMYRTEKGEQDGSEQQPRLNYERRYEYFHFIQDLLI